MQAVELLPSELVGDLLHLLPPKKIEITTYLSHYEVVITPGSRCEKLITVAGILKSLNKRVKRNELQGLTHMIRLPT
jgi:hypothetical protein